MKDLQIVDEVVIKMSICKSVSDLRDLAKSYHNRIRKLKSNNKEFDDAYKDYKSAKVEEEVKIISPYISGKKVLDYGCGSGHFTMLLSNLGYDIKGADVDDLEERRVLR